MRGTEAERLFDSQAETYDSVNTVISLGLDSRWRKWVAERAVFVSRARVLDAYCGTGLVGLAAASRGARVTFADISPRMLAVAAGRSVLRRLPAEFLLADLAEDDPPVEFSGFDAVTLSFGLRYMDDPAGQLERLASLLNPGGRLVLLEFVPPEPDTSLVRRAAALYFFRILPALAGRLAGDRTLYEYLRSSTGEMGSAEHVERFVADAGLRVAERRRMGFGLVHGVVAVR